MRIHTMLLVAGGALAAVPAAAQVNVGAGAGVGVGVGVNVPVRDTVTRTVDTTDRIANRTLDRTNMDLAVATGADVTAGAIVTDSRGRRIGTVQSVSANSVILVNGNHRLQVPISSLYRSADGLVTRMSRSQFNAQARAQADAEGSARARSRRPASRD